MATTQAKEFVADSLYRSLISLQSAMCINNQQQTQLLAQQSNINKTNISAEGSENDKSF